MFCMSADSRWTVLPACRLLKEAAATTAATVATAWPSPIILHQQETEMVAPTHTALTRRLQALACPSLLPFPSFDALLATSAGRPVLR